MLVTVATDSAEMYRSRLAELDDERGPFTRDDAIAAFERHLLGATTDHTLELTYPERKRIHNLKYFTWVEQQGKTYEEIQTQWYDPDYWNRIHRQAAEIDALIEQFNEMTGLLKEW